MPEDYGRPRRWTATITVVEHEHDIAYTPRRGETVNADLTGVSDLQRDMAAAAYLEAAKYLLAGLGRAAHVQLHKTTLAHGTVKDHSYSLDRHDAAVYARRAVAWQRSFHLDPLPAPPR